MEFLKNKGNIIIYTILSLNLILWFGSKVMYQDYFTNNFKYLSKIASLTATLLMALSLLLTTRTKWIDGLFGGLDKTYRTHHKLGRWAFILILLHPVFLSFMSLPSFANVVGFYIPNLDNQYNVGHAIGILALLMFFGLLYITIQIKLNYELWQASHSWFGLLFVIIILHIVFVNADIPKYPIFAGWYYFWLVIGVMSYIWSVFLKYSFGPTFEYKINSVEKINFQYEIILEPSTIKVMKYNPGQFVYTQFYNTKLPLQWHPFSISSFSDDNKFKLGIKELGDYTKQLGVLKVGDKVKVNGGYGRLSDKIKLSKASQIVMIGGGIGITPMVSIWEWLLRSKFKKCDLWYICKDTSEASFDNDIKDKIDSNGLGDNKYNLYLDQGINYFTIDQIGKKEEDFKDKLFIICGPERMMSALIEGLKTKGVTNNYIVTESFNFGIGSKKWIPSIKNS
jgi:predicted ferric reductase